MELGLQAHHHLSFIFIPFHLLFTPPEGFMSNLDPIDHLGFSKVVAIASDADDYMGFDTFKRQNTISSVENNGDDISDILSIYSDSLETEESLSRYSSTCTNTHIYIRKRSTSIGMGNSPFRNRSNSSGSLSRQLHNGIQLKIMYQESLMAHVPIKFTERFIDLFKIVVSYLPNPNNVSINLLSLKYKDDQGTLIHLTDQEDYQTALDTQQLQDHSDWILYVD